MNATAQKTETPAAEHTIELRKIVGKYGTERGAREIVVDGKLWGRIEQSAGGRSRAYRILQDHGDGKFFWIEREAWKDHWKPIEFRSTRPDRYDRAINKAKAEPLDDQLRRWIALLIAGGKLRDPTDVKADSAKAAAAHRKQAAERAGRELREFTDRAIACLEPIADGIGDNVKPEVVARIVDAMRWAQTK